MSIKGFVRDFEIQETYIKLFFDHTEILLHPNLNKLLSIHCGEQYSCCHCKKIVKKLFSQGYCYICSQRLSRCDLCVLQPIRCHFAQGTCREPEWAEQHCMIPHIVYLSWTSGYKIGLTRKNRLLTRWREQGALIAAPIFEAKTRHQAGIIEHQLSKSYPTTTNWRKMLNNHEINMNEFQEVYLQVAQQLEQLTSTLSLPYENTIINYPIYDRYQIKSLADKQPFSLLSSLVGIKGHYLLFKEGVLSVRSFIGREINIEITNATEPVLI